MVGLFHIHIGYFSDYFTYVDKVHIPKVSSPNEGYRIFRVPGSSPGSLARYYKKALSQIYKLDTKTPKN
jgi:hypothetical protein